VTGAASLTTTADASSGIGAYAINAAIGSLVAPNYAFAFADGTLTVNPATLTVTANGASRIYGSANPTFSDTIGGFVNGDTSAVVTGAASLTTTADASSGIGAYAINAAIGSLVAPNYAFAFADGTLTVSQDSTTATASAAVFGQSVTLTAQVTANAPGSGTPTGTVDFFDATTGIDLGLASLSPTGTATLTTAALPVATQTINVSYRGDTNFIASATSVSVTPLSSVYVLNPTVSGALTVSGNANMKVPGVIVVDSSSATAIVASGNAQITATEIDVVGGAKATGAAKVSPTPLTHHVAVSDPLAGLQAPDPVATRGAVSLSGTSSRTIDPGVYTQITVAGNSKLTMNPGVYEIAGGGFTVSGNASVTGNGVMIYNAGSNYLGSGASYGWTNISGNGQIKLTAPSTGPYAGLVIFQSRDNTQGLVLSGNALGGIAGTIYAPSAAASISGNASLNLALVVNTLTLSGNAVFNDVASQPTTAGAAAVFTPAQIRTAYSLDGLAADGTGQTIAVVDAYDNPAISNAVDTFDNQFATSSSAPTLYQQYGSADSFLTVLNQRGQAALAETDPAGVGGANWEVESALDVEWIHAMAPGARIVLVEADSQSLADLMSAVAAAAQQPGVSVVSMSWGFTEGQSVLAADEALYDGYLTTPAGHQGVTFVASTGDYGAMNPEYPAFSPNVVAVGGTTLTLNADNSYQSEAGWGGFASGSGAFYGGGGGVSLFEQQPSYQSGVQTIGYRTTPDVSFVADPGTGAWIADPYNLDLSNPWEIVGGTSLSAPAWAALLAIANQARVASGGATFGSSVSNEAQQALYSISPADYHDVIRGGNGYTAGAGYDLVTGLGTPLANKLVSDLAAYVAGSPIVVESSPLTAADAMLSGSGSFGVVNVGQDPANALPVFDVETIAPGGVADRPASELPPEPTAAGLPVAPAGFDDLVEAIASAVAQRTSGAAPSAPFSEIVERSFHDDLLGEAVALPASIEIDNLAARLTAAAPQTLRRLREAAADAIFDKLFD
jgi:hypothetical protein